MSQVTPLFYHPSSVLFIDDDPAILNSLSTRLDPHFPFVLEENPQKALDYLKRHCLTPADFPPDIIEENYEANFQADGEIETFDIDFSRLHGDLSSHGRFGKIQVAVVDRHIPGFDGLEFCRLVKEKFQLPIKTILLTGATTVDEAVQAFNEGRIDAFIPKTASAAPMSDKLNQLIKKLSWQQFYETSKHLAGLLIHNLKHISNPAFVEAFSAAREANHTVEFYLFDSSGSFLMFNREGKAKLFLVRSLKDFDTMLSLAEDSDASKSVLDDLRQRKSFPFCESKKSRLMLSGREWDKAMIPMTQLIGSDIFYAVVPVSDYKIVDFDHYANKIWPDL